MRHKLFKLMFVILWLVAALAVPAEEAKAETPTAGDVLSAVNALRKANGLPALKTDSALMSAAQTYANYLASTGQTGHYANGTPDTRASAAGFAYSSWDVQECWAWGGTSTTLSTIVYDYWGDAIHMAVMLHGQAKLFGAGVASKNGRVYYILDVGVDFGAAPSNPSTGKPAPSDNSSDTVDYSQYIYAVQTSTPQPDGSIIHKVLAGQAVESIAKAYGVTESQIIELNKLDPKNPVIYIGQDLIIKAANTPTPTPTITNTPLPVTRTPTLTRTPRPPRSTHTPTPTLTPTPAGLFSGMSAMNRQTLGMALIGISAVGLLAILFFSLKKK